MRGALCLCILFAFVKLFLKLQRLLRCVDSFNGLLREPIVLSESFIVDNELIVVILACRNLFLNTQRSHQVRNGFLDLAIFFVKLSKVDICDNEVECALLL